MSPTTAESDADRLGLYAQIILIWVVGTTSVERVGVGAGPVLLLLGQELVRASPSG